MVAECLAGDERAWSALLDRYKNLIYSIPLRYGTPHQDAADIFQAVCLDLFNELPKLARCRSLTRMADPRHREQVLSLETPSVRTGKRISRLTR